MTDTRRKRHHYVPEWYLKHWADEKQQVEVRLRDELASYKTHVRNVALEGDLYTIYGLGDEPDDSIEQVLGDIIDGPAAPLVAELGERIPKKRTDDRREISRFLAVQVVRTPDHIMQALFPALACEDLRGRSIGPDVVRRCLAAIHFNYEPPVKDVEAATDFINGLLTKEGSMPTREQALLMLFDIAGKYIAPTLEGKAWSVEIDPDGTFMTGDLPVSKYWLPAKRKMYMGIGMQDADEVRFPINPHHMLVMRPAYPESRYVIPSERVACINQQVANRCYRQVIARVEQRRSLADVVLEPRPLALRFNVAPLIGPGGVAYPNRDVIHQYVEHPDD